MELVKTLIIKAWVDGINRQINVRFVSPGSNMEPKDVELLPKGPSFLVIDDAHERQDLVMILNYLGRNRPEIKIVISSRPYESQG